MGVKSRREGWRHRLGNHEPKGGPEVEGKDGPPEEICRRQSRGQNLGAVPASAGQEEQERSGEKTERTSQEVRGQCLSQKKHFQKEKAVHSVNIWSEVKEDEARKVPLIEGPDTERGRKASTRKSSCTLQLSVAISPLNI